MLKRVNITERQAVEFQFQAINIFNHPQFVPGYISDIQPANGAITTSGNTHNALIPENGSFAQLAERILQPSAGGGAGVEVHLLV